MDIAPGTPPIIDWEEILLKLTAFTRSWVKGKSWFRGGNTTSFIMGKEVDDYVQEAIWRYLQNPEKFDPSKGELFEYLAYNLVRSFVSNDLRKKENNSTDDVFAEDGQDSTDESSTSYADRVLPYTAALFPDDIDYASIKDFIEKAIDGDKGVENIFLGLYTYDMKRRDIINEFNMTPADYDNAMRRLTTIMNRAATNFNAKNEAV